MILLFSEILVMWLDASWNSELVMEHLIGQLNNIHFFQVRHFKAAVVDLD